MRYLYTLVLACLFIPAFGRNATFEKLYEVNKCWAQQKDIASGLLPAYHPMNEKEWIRLHLSLVENTLRQRNTSGLTAAQKQNRAVCLSYLHEYWQAGNFPVNDDYTYRTPIFIDRRNNFCAVGYLVKVTGNEQLSRMIASKTNLAYVHDMKYPELATWAKENGFTKDELAWIQPGYPPSTRCIPIGKGVDSSVNELFADTVAHQLFVGGNFINVDSSITANNIAYVTESGDDAYTWHNMGSGVNGPVYAITKYNSKIFAAGSFSMAGGIPANNVAYWDGSAWHGAGCIAGMVQDLVVFNGSLYASGAFDVCDTAHNINFAKWNDTVWLPIPGLHGTVNTMEVMDTNLLLGGAFVYTGDTLNGINAIKWNSNTSFQSFTSPVHNEVKDFELFGDTMYAACRHTHPTDSTNLFLKLAGSSWAQAFTGTNTLSYFHITSTTSFNTLCTEPSSLSIGGRFNFNTPIMPGLIAENCFNVAPGVFSGTNNWFYVDSAVNKMVVFNGSLIGGGKFKIGDGADGSYITINGIAKRYHKTDAVSQIAITNTIILYPDPVYSAAALTVKNSFNASRYTIRDMNARIYATGILNNIAEQQIAIPNIAAGVYLLEISNDNGKTLAKQFEVR